MYKILKSKRRIRKFWVRIVRVKENNDITWNLFKENFSKQYEDGFFVVGNINHTILIGIYPLFTFVYPYFYIFLRELSLTFFIGIVNY